MEEKCRQLNFHIEWITTSLYFNGFWIREMMKGKIQKKQGLMQNKFELTDVRCKDEFKSWFA